MRVAALAPAAEHALPGAAVDAQASIRDKFPGSAISLSRSTGPGGAGALVLRWKVIWKSGALLSGPALDLRPYLALGTVRFDRRPNWSG